MVEIVIIIYIMLNIYTVKQKSLGYRFFLCTIMQNQGRESFLYRAPVALSDCPHSTGEHSADEVPNPWSNVLTTKCITFCTCVSIFSNIFKGVSTPLDHKCICNELEHLVALW